MKTELLYLVYATILTGLLWVPYVLDRFATWGIPDTVGYPESPKPQSPWAARMKKAHANAAENLVVFAALVLVANDVNVANAVTAGAAMAYFWGRVVHVLAYTFAIPWLRTLGFAVGFFAQAAIAWQLLAR
ncbi:MAG TPA: MAPEG family protein [Usitatibacter sp.]|nr:MAPEG family protein [Usitatibacter sp.]